MNFLIPSLLATVLVATLIAAYYRVVVCAEKEEN